MKKNIFLIIVLIVFIGILFYPKYSTEDEFNLTKSEVNNYINQLKNGNTSNIKKLFMYYHYSLNNYNKAFKIADRGAKLNDAESQFLLSLYYLRESYPYFIKNNKKKGLYWLRKSSEQGYLPAIKEFRKWNIP